MLNITLNCQITALAQASVSLPADRYPITGQHCLELAEQAVAFVRRDMYDETTRTLVRSWREGKGPVSTPFPLVPSRAGVIDKASSSSSSFNHARCSGRRRRWQQTAHSDDYAFLIQALLRLYSVSGKTSHLIWAIQLQEKMDDLFEDTVNGGYWASEQDDLVLVRMKEAQVGDPLFLFHLSTQHSRDTHPSFFFLFEIITGRR